MTKYQLYKSGQTVSLVLEDHELSSGGQGMIYNVKAPLEYQGYCAKIYRDAEHAALNEKKIEYMVRHKPANTNMSKIRICWPEYLVYDNKGTFVGYIMPLAFEGSRDLKIIEVYSPGKTIAQKYPKYTDWHNKYDLDTHEGFVNRIKMLYNWALALEIVHQSGKYVLVDLKPDNVLATATGKISIVDTDSFQIKDGNTYFKGPVATQEYFAKFAKDRNKRHLCQTQDCDCFALAISFYKILVGTHPYSGFKLLPPYDTDEYADIASRIDADLFVFGKNENHIEQLKSNNLHSRFAKLPTTLQSLFMSAFTQEHQPTAMMWKNTLKAIFDPMVQLKYPISPTNNGCDNTETKCLCVLVIDVSGSMLLSINSLNRAIFTFMQDIILGNNGFGESSKDQVELAIIQFDSEVKIVRKPGLIKGEKSPKLIVRGLRTNTADAIREAINIVTERKSYYKANGLSYYRPWIIMLTDGNPDPYNEWDIDSVSNEIKVGIARHKYLFTAIGVGSTVNKDFLEKISSGNYGCINKSHISNFFKALSASIGIDGVTNPNEDLLGNLNSAINVDF